MVVKKASAREMLGGPLVVAVGGPLVRAMQKHRAAKAPEINEKRAEPPEDQQG